MNDFQLKTFNELTPKERQIEMDGWLDEHDMTWEDINKYHNREEKNEKNKS